VKLVHLVGVITKKNIISLVFMGFVTFRLGQHQQ